MTDSISIIIVSWNVCELLRECLTSIEQALSTLDMEVIVVDSASQDGSQRMVESEFPWVKLIAMDENVGFPKGNNIGLSKAQGNYFLLLNPDTIVQDDAIEKLLHFMSDNQDVGIAGPQLIYADGSIQSSRRRFPTMITALFESTWLQPIAPKNVLNRYYLNDIPYDEIVDVDWVVGACLVARKEAVQEVGYLDEDYFMYSEELDWCKRMKGKGWRVVYYPFAKVVHFEGKSSEQAVLERHINFQRAKLRYFQKFHSSTVTWIIRVILLANYLIQLIMEGLKGLIGHKRQLRWQRVRIYLRVLRSGLSPAGE